MKDRSSFVHKANKIEIALLQRHEAIIKRRKALLSGKESFYNFEGHQIESFFWDATKAQHRNQTLWKKFNKIENALEENKEITGRMNLLKENYWAMVEGMYAVWIEEIREYEARNDAHQRNNNNSLFNNYPNNNNLKNVTFANNNPTNNNLTNNNHTNNNHTKNNHTNNSRTNNNHTNSNHTHHINKQHSNDMRACNSSIGMVKGGRDESGRDESGRDEGGMDEGEITDGDSDRVKKEREVTRHSNEIRSSGAESSTDEVMETMDFKKRLRTCNKESEILFIEDQKAEGIDSKLEVDKFDATAAIGDSFAQQDELMSGRITRVVGLEEGGEEGRECEWKREKMGERRDHLKDRKKDQMKREERRNEERRNEERRNEDRRNEDRRNEERRNEERRNEERRNEDRRNEDRRNEDRRVKFKEEGRSTHQMRSSKMPMLKLKRSRPNI